MSERDPRSLGRYELTGRLGEGGQGTVFLGRDPAGALVAVKLLRAHLSQSEESRARFLQEVAATKRVARFCTAQVLDADLAGAQPYIVSEYIAGPSLAAVVRSGGPRRGTALERIAVNTATALAGIHQAGVVHRDFKAANVLLGPDGPVVIDFGIAKALDAVDDGLTLPGYTVGTPGYMAPEQFRGGPVGPAADIFAWGATMVFAATGGLPFGNDQIPAVMYRILSEPPRLDGLTGQLRDLVAACLEKEPADRPLALDIVDRLLRRETQAGAWPAGGPAAPAAARQPAGSADDLATTPRTRPRDPARAAAAPPPARRGGRAALAGVVVVVLLAAAAVAAKELSGPAGVRRHALAAGLASSSAPAPRPAVSPSRRRDKHRTRAHRRHAALSPTSVPTRSSPRPSAVRSTPPPGPTHTPAPAPSPKPSPSGSPNPYTPAEVCGSGYTVIDSHPIARGTIYLLYDSASGDNCVTTMRTTVSRKIRMVARLRVQGGASAHDAGYYVDYAGPIYLAAAATCVEWGGSIGGAAWMSGWSHCG